MCRENSERLAETPVRTVTMSGLRELVENLQDGTIIHVEFEDGEGEENGEG